MYNSVSHNTKNLNLRIFKYSINKYLLASPSSSSLPFYPSFCLSFNNVLGRKLLPKFWQRELASLQKLWSIQSASFALLYVGYSFLPWLYITLLLFHMIGPIELFHPPPVLFSFREFNSRDWKADYYSTKTGKWT